MLSLNLRFGQYPKIAWLDPALPNSKMMAEVVVPKDHSEVGLRENLNLAGD